MTGNRLRFGISGNFLTTAMCCTICLSTASAQTVDFFAPELIGRPTDHSITINVVADAPIDAFFAYGTQSGDYTDQTGTISAAAEEPIEVLITGLESDRLYYYRMNYRVTGTTTWLTRDEHTFRTQRPRGSTFTFTIVSDSHLNNMLGNASLYQNTMENVNDDNPDFHLDLGDTFFMDGINTVAATEQRYLSQRPYLGIISHSAPVFLVAGNHEEEEGWNLDDTPDPADSRPIMSTNARKKYYLNPIPDAFYSGNTDTHPAISDDGLHEDYFSFEWGDALFVGFDPFWYTPLKPYAGAIGGEENDESELGDRWSWTLGQQQYDWLRQTLLNSTAKYKFVFAHHMLGGTTEYVRGGAEPAHMFEWGGENADGTWGFDDERPGWEQPPIHQTLVEAGVTAFFHGHDHQYAYEVRNGVVYQGLPMPSDINYGNGFNLYSESDEFTERVLPNSGHLRVTVAPDRVTVEYVRSFLSGGANGSVAHTYTMGESSPVEDLRASVMGENILLEWGAVAGASGYNVYRGTSYDFTPDLASGSNRIAEGIVDEDAGTADVQWTDTGNGADIVGDITTHYFYCVTAMQDDIESAPSNVAGEFDYDLITTVTTDINELVVLMNTGNTRLPISTAEELAQAIPNCSDVYYWQTSGQGTVGHVKGLPFNDFDVLPGYPYVVNVTSPTVWTVAGAYEGACFDLITTASTDINHLGVPLEKHALTTADALGLDIPGCTDVYYWDAPGQGSVGHVVGLPFSDFEVKAGLPYYANVTAGTQWGVCGGGGQAILKLNTENVEGNATGRPAAGGVPHTVYGKLEWDGDLDVSGLHIRAWIGSRPDEILTRETTGTGCDQEYWYTNVGNFPSRWNAGETLSVEVTCEGRERLGSTTVILSDAGSDDGGSIVLKELNTVDRIAETVPSDFILFQNYPNPFNAETEIEIGVPRASEIDIRIFDVSGRLVRALVSADVSAGRHRVRWDGRDESGRPVSSGVYLCRMESDRNVAEMIKMIYIR